MEVFAVLKIQFSRYWTIYFFICYEKSFGWSSYNPYNTCREYLRWLNVVSCKGTRLLTAHNIIISLTIITHIQVPAQTRFFNNCLNYFVRSKLDKAQSIFLISNFIAIFNIVSTSSDISTFLDRLATFVQTSLLRNQS